LEEELDFVEHFDDEDRDMETGSGEVEGAVEETDDDL